MKPHPAVWFDRAIVSGHLVSATVRDYCPPFVWVVTIDDGFSELAIHSCVGSASTLDEATQAIERAVEGYFECRLEDVDAIEPEWQL